MPAVFVGHGNPTHALRNNDFTRAWRALGASLPRPRAVLAISAHWYVEGSAVTGMERPRTIHDFGGFPEELYRLHYPAPGDPAFAKQVIELLAPHPVGLDADWGLDHGTWCPLLHAYPEADVPVVQLSVDMTAPPERHWELGTLLAPLRDENVLVLASGNVVHNLARMHLDATEPFDWAVRFDEHVRNALEAHDERALVDYLAHRDGHLAAPTPDHYLPLLYVAAMRAADEPITYPVVGFDLGSISMRAVQVG